MVKSSLGIFENRDEYLKAWRKARYETVIKKRVMEIRKHLLEKRTKCIRCGENHPACLDFHHRDPKKKSFRLIASQIGNRSWKTVETEIDKCDVLCSNCHRKHHYNVRNGELQ